jgi:hypothetical protein
MKYRWKNGKAQAISYVPALGRCAVVREASSIHELYGGDDDEEDDSNEDDEDEDDEDEDDEDEDDEDEEY